MHLWSTCHVGGAIHRDAKSALRIMLAVVLVFDIPYPVNTKGTVALCYFWCRSLQRMYILSPLIDLYQGNPPPILAGISTKLGEQFFLALESFPKHICFAHLNM